MRGRGRPTALAPLAATPAKTESASVGPIQCHGVALLASIDVDSSLFGIMEEGSFKLTVVIVGWVPWDPSNLYMYIYSFLDKMHV